MGRLLLPLGQTDFRTIRENGSYYVDKTGHIGQIIRDSASSILFTRPRRFGKTTFQSTLRAFFDIREDNKDIFTGLAIMDDEEAVEGWMNKWPVIHLTFKDIDGPSFSSAMGWMNTQIRDLYKSYSFLDDGKLGGDEAMFRRILDKNASTDDICQSLRLLVELLYDHYGKKVIILLDEYDVPLAKAEGNGYYSEMLSVHAQGHTHRLPQSLEGESVHRPEQPCRLFGYRKRICLCIRFYGRGGHETSVRRLS